jgi:hypothetical protein
MLGESDFKTSNEEFSFHIKQNRKEVNNLISKTSYLSLLFVLFFGLLQTVISCNFQVVYLVRLQIL